LLLGVFFFLIIFNVIFIGTVSGGWIVFSKKIRDIEKLKLSEKLKKYREASLVRAATIEGAAFLFIVGFMITGVFIFFTKRWSFSYCYCSTFPQRTGLPRRSNRISGGCFNFGCWQEYLFGRFYLLPLFKSICHRAIVHFRFWAIKHFGFPNYRRSSYF
jgi:hypothetical protein